MEMFFMDTFEEKRKNDDRRGFPWRATFFIVIGFALGVIVTLIFAPGRVETVTYMSGDDFARSEISVVQPAPDQNGFELTATRIIQQATEMAGGIFSTPLPVQQSGQGDPLFATATKIIQNATATQNAIQTATAGS
jgi:hypothetical protein